MGGLDNIPIASTRFVTTIDIKLTAFTRCLFRPLTSFIDFFAFSCVDVIAPHLYCKEEYKYGDNIRNGQQ